MKRDKYAEQLDAVTAQAVTKWDIERMRDALAESRTNLERRFEAIKRAEFAQNSGMTKR